MGAEVMARGLSPEDCATCKAVALDPRLRCGDHPFGSGRGDSPEDFAAHYMPLPSEGRVQSCACCGKVGPPSPSYPYDGLWWCSPACATGECGHGTGANAASGRVLTRSQTRCHRCLEWNDGDPWYCDRCGKETTLTPHDGGTLGDVAAWTREVIAPARLPSSDSAPSAPYRDPRHAEQDG